MWRTFSLPESICKQTALVLGVCSLARSLNLLLANVNGDELGDYAVCLRCETRDRRDERRHVGRLLIADALFALGLFDYLRINRKVKRENKLIFNGD